MATAPTQSPASDGHVLDCRRTFGLDRPQRGESRTRWVVALTAVVMVVEIVAGNAFGSMALLADGWHMGTHAAALGVTLFTYAFARKHAHNPRYTFGTGKVGALGGFASAVGLALVSLLVFVESLERLRAPVSIRFDEAIAVAVLGLLVNLVSAWLLRESEHGHGHGHGHGRADHETQVQHGAKHRDHNLRGAFLHVIADALTSVVAIAALVVGRQFGWAFMDPLMGVAGSVVICTWSYGLLRDTSRVLLDAEVDPALLRSIRTRIEEAGADRVIDLHVWRVGPTHLAAILSIVTSEPREPAHYKGLLEAFPDLAHVTVEVEPARAA